MRYARILIIITAALLFASIAASMEEGSGTGDGPSYTIDFLWIALILIIAKLSSLVEKWGQPAVLGELIVGVILGNLTMLGINALAPIGTDPIILFLSELGVIILLFQIGLESNIEEMKKVGVPSMLVAIVGVIVPFVLGTVIIGPWLLPGLSQNAYLFLGATLTATSVGITARVFKDLGKLHTKEARIVLGAAVIDDVFGLVILAVVSAIVTAGSVSALSVGIITLKALVFLIGSIMIGQKIASPIGKWLSEVHIVVGMKFALAASFCFIFASFAQVIGLAPIVGAFAAAPIMKPVQFTYVIEPEVVTDIKEHIKNHHDQQAVDRVIQKHSHKHVEDLIAPLGLLFVPIFFVLTGFTVNLATLFDVKILLIALGITIAAVIGKVVACYAVKGVDRKIVGWGMVPRGEVGLIFATIGKGLGVVSDQVYSVIVIVVILTTLMTPPILSFLIKRMKTEAPA